MKHVAAFLSERQDWGTPQAFFDHWNDKCSFTLDAAASALNAKVDGYYTESDDALTQPWTGIVWCNPPYSRHIGKWIKKGYDEARRGAHVVMLIPARTDTRWWHTYVMHAAEVWFIKGRLRFTVGGKPDNAPFPSCVVIFDKHRTRPTFETMDAINDER